MTSPNAALIVAVSLALFACLGVRRIKDAIAPGLILALAGLMFFVGGPNTIPNLHLIQYIGRSSPLGVLIHGN